MAITPEQARAELARRELYKRQSNNSPSLLDKAKLGGRLLFDFGKSSLSDPQRMARSIGPALPIAGGMIGSAVEPGLGTAAGAGIGSILGNMASIYGGDPNAPRTPGRAATEAMINTAVSGFPETPEAGKLADFGKKQVAKTFEALAGPKASTYLQAMKQGLKTYLAPSMEKASAGFEQALEKEGIPRPPLEARYDPQLSHARETATNVMKEVEAGRPVNAEQALRGRQAVDRVVAGTSYKDKSALTEMYKDRQVLNDLLSNQSGPLKQASENYRKAIVKNQLTRPLRITGSGRPSAFLTIMSMLDALGANSFKPLAYTALTGPAATGLAATAGGDIGRLLAKPGVRQAITAEILRRTRSNENPNP